MPLKILEDNESLFAETGLCLPQDEILTIMSNSRVTVPTHFALKEKYVAIARAKMSTTVQTVSCSHGLYTK